MKKTKRYKIYKTTIDELGVPRTPIPQEQNNDIYARTPLEKFIERAFLLILIVLVLLCATPIVYMILWAAGLLF